MPSWLIGFSIAFAVSAILTYIFMKIVPFKTCMCHEMYVKGFGDGEKFGKETAELDKKFDEASIYKG